MVPIRKPRGLRVFNAFLPCALGATLLLAGCGDAEVVVEDVRERRAHYDYIPRTSQQRFEPKRRAPAHGAGASNEVQLAWDLPEGWAEAPLTQYRKANFKIGADTQCYLSITGGGVEANVNRWRKQMGLKPQSFEEMKAFPQKKLGPYDALVVDLEGSFTGMSGGQAAKGYRMLGLIVQDQQQTIVLKMVGPADVVLRERPSFFRIAKSIRRRADGENPHGGGDPHASAGAEPKSDYQWTAPKGWKRGKPKMERLVTYHPADGVQCYISILVAGGGGIGPNVNRWRRQMGKPPLSNAEIGNLKKVRLLGQDAPLLELMGGKFTDMDGKAVDGAALMGAMCIDRGRLITIKMTGPTAAVEKQREAFIAFCESLEPVK